MVDIKQLLSPNNGLPIINDVLIPRGTPAITNTTSINKQVMRDVKNSPEAIGIIRKIVNDINSRVSFKTIPTKKVGRPKNSELDEKEAVAERFARKNFFREIMDEYLYDWAITGDSYVWKGKVSVEGAFRIPISDKNFMDEAPDKTNFLRVVPSSTVTPAYDQSEILSYRQQVNEFKREWLPKDIVHAVFMKLDGKVSGYTPMKASGPVIKTLGLIKDYAGQWFQGGGMADVIYSFEEEMMDSPSFRKLKQEIQTYADAQRQGLQKRGSAVVAGKLKVDKINEFNKDMEFRQLMLTYVGLLAFAFQMPASMLKAILGGEVKESSGGSDVSASDYWKNVRKAQEYMEDLWNTQFWIPSFGVEMTFRKTYLVDEIKEAQNKIFLSDVMTKTNQVLAAYDKKIELRTVMDRLDVRPDEIRDMTVQEKEDAKNQEMSQNGNPKGFRQGQQDKLSGDRGEATQSVRKQKKDEQNKKV